MKPKTNNKNPGKKRNRAVRRKLKSRGESVPTTVRQYRKLKKRKVPRRRSKSGYGAPQTAQQLFARPRHFQEQWNAVVQAVSEIRSQDKSLHQASRQFGIKPEVLLRLARPAFKKNKAGRYQVKSSDRLLRILQIPSGKGLAEIAVKSSGEASLIGEYWSAVEKYLARGDASSLQNLRRKTVKDSKGKRIRLLTDLDVLRVQASAGVLHFESIYGRNA